MAELNLVFIVALESSPNSDQKRENAVLQICSDVFVL